MILSFSVAHATSTHWLRTRVPKLPSRHVHHTSTLGINTPVPKIRRKPVHQRDSHCSGVRHLAVQACTAAISSLSAVLTRRWRLREVRPANWGETMVAWKAWPQPPKGVLGLGLVWSEHRGQEGVRAGVRTYVARERDMGLAGCRLGESGTRALKASTRALTRSIGGVVGSGQRVVGYLICP